MTENCPQCGAEFESMDHVTDHLMDVHDAFTAVAKGYPHTDVTINIPFTDFVDFVNAAGEHGEPVNPRRAFEVYAAVDDPKKLIR